MAGESVVAQDKKSADITVVVLSAQLQKNFEKYN